MYALAAVDIGAESGRVILGQVSADSIELREIHRFLNVPVRIAETLYWDFPYLYSQVISGIGKVLTQCERLESVGIDTWGVDFGLIDKRGRLLQNPVHYRDRRTKGIMEKAFKAVPKQEIYEKTGIQFMEINTIYQLYSLIVDNDPLLEIADKILMIPDLFNHFLTGGTLSEFTNASTTQMYDCRSRAWVKDLVGKLGIRSDLFPEVVDAGTEVGYIEVEELPKGIKLVAPATHDTGSAVAGTPFINADNSVFISCGTWALVGMETKQPIVNQVSMEWNLSNEGGVHGTTRFLKNVMGLWLLQECRRQWAKEGVELGYDVLVDNASKVGQAVALIDPDNPEFLYPGDLPARIKQFCAKTEQPIPEGPAQIARTIMESLALKFDFVISLLKKASSREVERIHIVGGGSRNTLLCQLTADATGLEVVAGPAEATALGNIGMQGVALGIFNSIHDVRLLIGKLPEIRTYSPINDMSNKKARFSELLGVSGVL